MPAAATVRMQIESSLAARIPSALTPQVRAVRPVAATGIGALDELVRGGLPVGALTELVGAECAGRTSVALSFVAQVTREEKVVAWIDTTDSFDPCSAAAAGVDLARVLWVRCGAAGAAREEAKARSSFALPEAYFVASPPKRGLHGGGFGGHPRGEVKGLSAAVGDLLQEEAAKGARCCEPMARRVAQVGTFEPSNSQPATGMELRSAPAKSGPWARVAQAIRCADLIVQAGGFSAVVLDMAGLRAEVVSRIPLNVWHRYRLGAERTQASLLLLTQYACARSSSELQLRMAPARALEEEATIFTGIAAGVEIARHRFAKEPVSNVIPMRKPPQRVGSSGTGWESRAVWTGKR